MENFGSSNYENPNIKHDLVTIASSERLFSILDKKTQEKILRFVYKYTKECLGSLEQQYGFIDEEDEEIYNQRGSR